MPKYTEDRENNGSNSSPEKQATLARKRNIPIVLVEIVNQEFAGAWIDVCVTCRKKALFRLVRRNSAGDDVVTTHCHKDMPIAALDWIMGQI